MSEGIRGTGPIISALPETTEQTAVIEGLNLDRLRAKVFKYGDEVRVLETVRKFIPPTEASPTTPEVVQLLYDTPGVMPELSWEDFVRGVACVANIIKPEDQQAIKDGLQLVAERVVGGGDLPALDLAFASEILECQAIILANGEMTSYRRLMSFMQGSFWLLTYVAEPRKRRAGKSPLEWTHEMVKAFAELAYVPR